MSSFVIIESNTGRTIDLQVSFFPMHVSVSLYVYTLVDTHMKRNQFSINAHTVRDLTQMFIHTVRARDVTHMLIHLVQGI